MAKEKKSKFMQPMQISEELAAIVGRGPMPRTEVTKKLWGYIKAHKCQDTKNKRNIIPDDKTCQQTPFLNFSLQNAALAAFCLHMMPLFNTFVSAILLAGGKGKRMQSSTPKQYLPLGGKPLALYSLELFAT